MRVSIEVIGPIHRKPAENPATVELPPGSRVLDLMKHLGYEEREARYLSYLRGGEALKLYGLLQDGDSLQAVLHVGGG